MVETHWFPFVMFISHFFSLSLSLFSFHKKLCNVADGKEKKGEWRLLALVLEKEGSADTSLRWDGQTLYDRKKTENSMCDIK